MTAIPKTTSDFKVEDLLNPDIPEKFVEVIRGELVIMTPPKRRHNRVAERLKVIFEAYCASHPDLTVAAPGDGYILRRNSDTYAVPDSSIYRTKEGIPEQWIDFGPALALEVLSPSNRTRKFQEKIQDYLAAGADQVWLVDPDANTLEILFGDGRRVFIDGGDTVTCEGVVDGMVVDLSKIFAPTK